MRIGSAELGFYSIDIPHRVLAAAASPTLARRTCGRSPARLAASWGWLASAGPSEGPTNLLPGLKPALRERLVPPFLRAEISACFCLTEPDASSDNQSMRARAEKVGDEWVINVAPSTSSPTASTPTSVMASPSATP